MDNLCIYYYKYVLCFEAKYATTIIQITIISVHGRGTHRRLEGISIKMVHLIFLRNAINFIAIVILEVYTVFARGDKPKIMYSNYEQQL